MKKATVNDYFRHHWVKLMLFALFTAAVSFFAPLKNFQLKWLIDSKSKQEALGYMGLVFLITFTSWFFERLSRRSFTKLACGAVEQVRGQVMERVLRRPVSQYQREGDAAYLSLLTTDLRTLYDDYYMSLFNIAFWGGIMLCAIRLSDSRIWANPSLSCRESCLGWTRRMRPLRLLRTRMNTGRLIKCCRGWPRILEKSTAAKTSRGPSPSVRKKIP